MRGSIATALLLVGLATAARAQVPADTTKPAVDTTQPLAPTALTPLTAFDTAAGRPTTPTGAMLRSFLLPGWGQALYGRKVTAGVMLGIEGLALGMTLKVSGELQHIRTTGSASEDAKLQEREDWLAILVFNHLMSGLEAYVSAHLYDFPGDLNMRALPEGGMGVGMTLPLGGR